MKFHFSQGSVNKADRPLTYQESLMLDIQKTRCELEKPTRVLIMLQVPTD